MRRLEYLLFTMVVVAVAVLSRPAAGEEVKLAKGALQKYHKHIAALMKLTWTDGRLDLDEEHWNAAFRGKTRKQIIDEIASEMIERGYPKEWAQRTAKDTAEGSKLDLVFGRLQAAVGPGGMSSSSGMGKSRCSFRGDDLNGSYSRVWKDHTLRVSESESPGRIVTIEDKVDGTLNFSIIDPSGELIVILRQNPKGATQILHVQGFDVNRLKGDSFLDIYRNNREYVNERLFPVMKQLGVTPPMGLYDERLVAAVVSELRGKMDEAEQQKVDELIVQLDSAEYPMRKSATEKLTRNFVRYRSKVEAALKKDDLSREARMRLEKVVADNPLADRYGKIISGMHLLEDPEYLIDLLAIVKDRERALVVKRLEKLSGKDYGEDAEKWRSWLEEKQENASGS
ncbi:MAG: hypothetical protein ACLFV7_14020 [Phycisphaerae bacterium]